MPPIRHIFLDDGDVMNDNAVRGPQWQQLIGEFFVPRLGGTMDAWAAANVAVVSDIDDRYFATLTAGDWRDAGWRLYKIDWLRSMAAHAGIAAPEDDDACHDLADAAMLFVSVRIRAAYPGAVDAIHELSREYQLFTASNEHSDLLRAYLDGMGVAQLFSGFYGANLVEAIKPQRDYYERIFADAGVDPAASLVVDDKLSHLESARAVGARIVIVSREGPVDDDMPTIRALAELPALLRSRLLN